VKTKQTAIDRLRHIVQWLSHESEAIIQELPSIEKVVAYVTLLEAYDVESWENLWESIAEGENPDKALAFVRDPDLPGSWRKSIRTAMAERDERGQ